MGAAKSMTVKSHKLRTPLLIDRIEDVLLSSSPPAPFIHSHLIHAFDALSTISPSPSTADYPPIFLSPSSFTGTTAPSPSPSSFPAILASSSSGRSSLPKAAIVGGSVAGAVVALAITATVVSTVAGKVGLSCIFAPALRLLTSFGSAVASQCAKLDSLCSKFQDWTRKKDGSDKAGNTAGGNDGNNIDLYEVLAGYSPEAAKKAETAAATAYSLAKSPLIHDVVKAHDAQLGTSAQAFITTQVCDFAEAELKKQTELMMQPLNQNLTKAQRYFESLYGATSNASDELYALKSSAHTYLHDASKLKASAEQISKFDVALMLDEAVKGGAEKIKNSSIAIEYAAEMERLQKLQPAVVIDEEAVLNRLLGKAIPPSKSNVHEITLNNAGVDRGGPVCIVETPSDANELLQEEWARAIAPYHGDMDQPYMARVVEADATHYKMVDESSTTTTLSCRRQPAISTSNMEALVPTTASAGAQDAIKPTTGPIVPMPRKAITPVPMETMTAAKKPTWQLTQQGKGGKRPTNLGHVSFSCEMSAHRLFFFTSCRSGGSYGSPPHSHAREDVYHDHNKNQVEMQQLEYWRNNNKGGVLTDYYSNSRAPYPASYGGNHVGLLATSSSDPMKHHHKINVQDHHSITNSTSSNQISSPNTSIIMPTSHSPLDYGSPFDGVL